MRIGVIPTKSLAHKQTCLNLYRTLLRQTLLLPPDLSTTLLDVITQRFHLDRKILSPTVIVSALQTARSALNLIHSAAHNDAPSIESLANIVNAIQLRARQTHQTLLHQHSLRRPTSPSKLPRLAHYAGTNTKKWAERIPNSPPILSRPVPQHQLPRPDEPRRVPYLVNAQGVPFLRYKSGPQSVTLSHVLRSRARQATHRWELHDRLVEDINHGSLEDNWDSLIYKNIGIRDDEEVNIADLAQRNAHGASKQRNTIRGRGGEAVVEFQGPKGSTSWTGEVGEALDIVKGRIAGMMNEREKMARTMKRIMEGERTLAEKEKKERKEAARAKWLVSVGLDVSTETAAMNVVREDERKGSKNGMSTAIPFSGKISKVASEDTEMVEKQGRRKMSMQTTSTPENEQRRLTGEMVTVSPFARSASESTSGNSIELADPGHWKIPDEVSPTPTSYSTSRKKTVRRPWDPDWIPKPRRWK